MIYGYSVNDLAGPEYRGIRDPHLAALGRYRNPPLYLWRVFGPRFESLRSLAGRPAKGSYLYKLDENYFRNPAALRVMQEAPYGRAGSPVTVRCSE